MLNVLCINNLKCGHNCKCNKQTSITNIRFECILIVNQRGQMWSTVENNIPPAMITGVDLMSLKEKLVFIYNCLNGLPLQEWMSIYRALSKYVVGVSKEWYNKVWVEIADDGE